MAFTHNIGPNIVQARGAVWPLEVKAGVNPKSQSLLSYDRQFHPPHLVRATLLNLKKEDRILNLPLYLINTLPRFLDGRPF
jgi:hypothetical protein